jgi:hypothetical protein
MFEEILSIINHQEIQIKTTVKCYFFLVRMGITKATKDFRLCVVAQICNAGLKEDYALRPTFSKRA